MLPRLLKLQALDQHDIEAVYPLYQHIMHQLNTATQARHRTDTAVRAAADGPPLRQSNNTQPAGVNQRTDTAVRAAAAGPGLRQSNKTEPEGSVVQPEYVQALLAMSTKEQVEIIRQYLLAATAKDCSLMITMQAQPAAEGKPMHNASVSQPQNESPCAAVVRDRPHRQIVYNVTVVDLDQKPHSKIRDHYSLNCEIMKCALALARVKRI